MKKLFALLVALSLCFAFVGCDNEDETIEVVRINGMFTLTTAELDNYLVCHGIVMSPYVDGFLEMVGFLHKNHVTYENVTLTNNSLERTMLKKCIPLSKAEIITILTNIELDTISDIGGSIFLKHHPFPKNNK